MWFTERRGLDGNVFFLLWPDLSKCVQVVAGREIYFERMMKRGIKRVKGKDQRDKILISFCTGLLPLTRPWHSAGWGDWISPLFSASPFVLLCYHHITSRHLSPPTWIFCLLVPSSFSVPCLLLRLSSLSVYFYFYLSHFYFRTSH